MNYDISSSGGLVTAFLDGGNPFRYLIYEVFSGNMIAIIAAVVAVVLVAFTWKVTHKQAYLEGEGQSE